jgi:hypothetical protein
MAVMGDGFAVQCFGCRKTFSSKGLRCCSATCERNYLDRQETLATMATLGMERLYVRRKCRVCPGEISPLDRHRQEAAADHPHYLLAEMPEKAADGLRCPNRDFDERRGSEVPIKRGLSFMAQIEPRPC